MRIITKEQREAEQAAMRQEQVEKETMERIRLEQKGRAGARVYAKLTEEIVAIQARGETVNEIELTPAEDAAARTYLRAVHPEVLDEVQSPFDDGPIKILGYQIRREVGPQVSAGTDWTEVCRDKEEDE